MPFLLKTKKQLEYLRVYDRKNRCWIRHTCQSDNWDRVVFAHDKGEAVYLLGAIDRIGRIDFTTPERHITHGANYTGLTYDPRYEDPTELFNRTDEIPNVVCPPAFCVDGRTTTIQVYQGAWIPRLASVTVLFRSILSRHYNRVKRFFDNGPERTVFMGESNRDPVFIYGRVDGLQALAIIAPIK